MLWCTCITTLWTSSLILSVVKSLGLDEYLQNKAMHRNIKKKEFDWGGGRNKNRRCYYCKKVGCVMVLTIVNFVD